MSRTAGEVALPKDVRSFLGMGDKVSTINAGDQLKVIPLPSDPLLSLNCVLDNKKPFRQLRGEAEALAHEETALRKRP